MFSRTGTGDGNIDCDLFEFILHTQGIEYGSFDSAGMLLEHSTGLLSLHTNTPVAHSIYEIFPELTGYEQILHDMIAGLRPALKLASLHCVDSMTEDTYYDLDIHPYRQGMLVIVRDVSSEVSVDQHLTQSRNELDLLAGKLVVDLQTANFDLKQAYEKSMEGWAKALEMRDDATSGHSQRVTELTIRLAREVGVADSEHLMHYWRGSMLHDIGKLGIPDSILFKPGPLTKEEWDVMKKHPLYSVELLQPIAYLKESLDIPMYHHEKWNGSGYPYGLKGEDIPLAARIFAVVDAWDALISDRPYQKAVPPEKALEIIRQDSGTHFDPNIVTVFIQLYERQEI